MPCSAAALDDFFGGSFVEEVEAPGGALDEGRSSQGSGLRPGERAFGGEFASDRSNAWHFLLVRLEDGVNPAFAIAEFQRFFDERGIDAMAQGWLTGRGLSCSARDGDQDRLQRGSPRHRGRGHNHHHEHPGHLGH